MTTPDQNRVSGIDAITLLEDLITHALTDAQFEEYVADLAGPVTDVLDNRDALLAMAERCREERELYI